jgi:hypothetical protein
MHNSQFLFTRSEYSINRIVKQYMIRDKSLKELQNIYKKEFDKEISKEEALEIGLRLINLFTAIIGSYPTNKN